MTALDRLQRAPAVAAGRRRRDIEAGREVVGTFSPPVPPPEVIEAAGALPFRLLESSGPDADLRGMGVLGRDTCSFCRAVLGSAVLSAPPVTCIAGGSACDRLRRMADAWPAATGIPAYTVVVPRTREGPDQVAFLADELRQVAEQQWEGQNVRVSTSEFYTGHLSLGARRMTITRRPRAGDGQLPHVADVEESGVRPHGHVLGDHALILNGHVPACERDHPRACGQMEAVERRVLQLG